MKQSHSFRALTLAIAALCPIQACSAQSLSDLTPSCARQAQDSVATGATSGPGTWLAYFYDDKSPNALRVEIANTTFSDINTQGLELLSEASDANNRSYSASARGKAQKILTSDATARSYKTLAPIAESPDSTGTEYVCFSDVCPQGTTCQAINLTRSGNKLLKELPHQKRLHKRILRWAQEAGVSREKIAHLREIHGNNVKLFKKTVGQLQGQTIYVSRGVMSSM